MALTANTMSDCPDCLIVVWVDESKADGAIAQVDATNRRTGRTLTVWAIYQGNTVTSPPIDPGTTYTQTFRGQQPRAGDVSTIGWY